MFVDDNQNFKLKQIWCKYKHLLILSYYGIICLFYTFLNRTVTPDFYMHSVIDDYIPFVKIFIVPYVFWYFYIAIALIYFGLTSRANFIKLTLFMFSGMTICFLIYLVFPNGQNLRPIISDQDFCSRLIRHLYQIDKPTNVAPSIHVLNSIAVHISVIRSKKLQNKKWIQYGSLISAILISLSTVFIKQHSIVDGVYAVILSYILYRIIYGKKKAVDVQNSGF